MNAEKYEIMVSNDWECDTTIIAKGTKVELETSTTWAATFQD